MGNLKRYKLAAAAIAMLGLTMFVSARHATTPVVVNRAVDLPLVRAQVRLINGVNLTRPHDPRSYILKTVNRSLKSTERHRAFQIARAVILESNRQHLDPLLLLAVIKTESQFDINARGIHGEIGLMQLMPATAAWVSRDKRPINLEDPVVNIRIGALYLAHLRQRFPQHTHRFVAAYNMGAKNVRRLLASRTEPRVYADRVLGTYRDLSAGLKRQTIRHAREIAAQNM